MTTFRLVDLRTNPPTEIEVLASGKPEDVASKALGQNVVRSGSRSNFIAKIYFQHPDQPMSMVRLYQIVRDGRVP